MTIREGIKEIFSEDMILAFWTHEKCPPNINDEFRKCQLDKDIKHERCLPCWEKWVDDLVEKVLQKEHSLGVVMRVKCPDCEWSQFTGEYSVGMTPCYTCFSTGFITRPLI